MGIRKFIDWWIPSGTHIYKRNSGNVGIGTSAPRCPLSITNGTDNISGDSVKEVVITAPTSEPSSTGAGNLFIQSNDAMAADKGGSIGFGTRVFATGTTAYLIAAIFGAKENSTDANYGGYLAFFTRSLSAINTERMRIDANGAIIFPSTITAPGTLGAQTINKPVGRVNFSATASSLVVTNSLVTANSIVLAEVANTDATARITSVVPSAGSFTIYSVAVTGETPVNFLVVS